MVMMCINRFSKMVQLVPLWESNAQTVPDKFLSTVVSQHRLPECITSDRDPRFRRHFWEELMSLLDMKLTFSMASHPQTDGMAEVTSCTMEKTITNTCIIEKLGEEATTCSHAN